MPHRELGCETLRLDELREMRRLAVQYEVPLHAIVQWRMMSPYPYP